MHKNHDLNIEQTRLNHAYQQLNSNQDLYSYHNNIEDDQPLYWAFLKLRIGFSILFLFFLIACFKTAPVKESKKVQSIHQTCFAAIRPESFLRSEFEIV